MLLALLAIILSYLVGAVPSAYIIVKLVKGVDIRNYGSGNVGFTNALRVIGFLPGIIVLLADIGKGLLAVLIISKLGGIKPNILLPYMPVLCAFFAIIGHIWTVFLKFHGGKGVATSLGIFFGLNWLAGLLSLIVWLLVVAITRYVSLGSILLCITFCIVIFIDGGHYVFDNINIWSIRALGIVITALVIYKHKSNIQRLLKGEERKFGQKIDQSDIRERSYNSTSRN